MKNMKFACHCCGFLTLDEYPEGSYEICPVCFWENNHVQLRDPTWIGANKVSLLEARENFARFGAAEDIFKSFALNTHNDDYTP
jgi:Cysteine-rich CPCC